RLSLSPAGPSVIVLDESFPPWLRRLFGLGERHRIILPLLALGQHAALIARLLGSALELQHFVPTFRHPGDSRSSFPVLGQRRERIQSRGEPNRQRCSPRAPMARRSSARGPRLAEVTGRLSRADSSSSRPCQPWALSSL